MSVDADGLVSVESTPTVAEHQAAFGEVAFLLDMFARTIDDLMGGATVTVGRTAGREAGKKLPVYVPNPTLDSVLPCVADQLKRGWDIHFERTPGGAAIQFERCAIRAACESRGQQPGGALCALFHSYFDGIVNELTFRPTRSTIESAGPSCRVLLQTR